MELIRTEIRVGLERPVRLLHVTDAHMTAFSPEDPPEQAELLKKRRESFLRAGGGLPTDGEGYFRLALSLAEELGALPVVTGDIADLHSRGNIGLFREIVGEKDMMFTPGGHEHQRIIRRTMEEEGGYAEAVRGELSRELSRFDLDFESRIINGLNVVTADNSLDYYSAATVSRFEAELERGLPMIVFSHDPVNDPRLGITEPYHPNVRLSPEDYALSNRMRDALLHDDTVVATVGGHWHRSAETVLFGKTHYVTDGLFRGVCRLIQVV